MPIVANGQFLPTESGLSAPGGLLERLQQSMDARSAYEGNLRGFGPALNEAGIPVAQPAPGILSQFLGSLGFGEPPAPTSAAPAPAAAAPAAPTTPVPPNVSMGQPEARPSSSPSLPTFAAAPATNPNGLPTRGDIAAYIAKSAQARGINPGMAIRVALSEGGLSPGRVGDNGSSFSTYQLHYGGMAPGGNSVPGLGDDFTARTGLDARDPANWKAATDFALDDAAKNGWGKFHGAAKAGIGNFDGITGGGAPMPIATSEPHVDPSTQPPGAPGGGAPAWQAQVRTMLASADPSVKAQGMALWKASVTGQQPGGGQQQPGGLTLPNGLSKQALAAMISEPTTQQIGLKLYAQALAPRDTKIAHAGDYLLTDQGVPLFHAPDKAPDLRFEQLNGRQLALNPQTGASADVTPAGLPTGFRPATPQEKQAYNVQPDAPLFFGPDGKPTTFNNGTNVTVNNAANPILAGLGKQFVDQRGEADAAAKSLPMIQTARSQLQSGIIAGAGANQMLGLQKIAVQLGLPGVDAARITNTETFSAAVKPLVMQLVKNLGSGNGITDADVRFVNQAVGGDTTLEPASLARILDITERAARNKITDYNTLADQMLSTPGGEAYKHIAPMMHVQMPGGQMPAAGATKTIGGTTYTQGPDGHWYSGGQ